MGTDLPEKKEELFILLEKYFLSHPPLPPIDTIPLANSLNIKLEPFEGEKENIKDLFLIKDIYKFMGIANLETNIIHYNSFLNKPYLNFLIAHDIAHILGNFSSPMITKKESNEADNTFMQVRTNPLSETLADTFATTLLYPRSHFIYSLLHFGIKNTLDMLSPLYPQANILFKLLFNMNRNSFFIFIDPKKRFFTQFTLKILKKQTTNIDPMNNILTANNVILSDTNNFGPLVWFGNLIDSRNILSHIYVDDNSKQMMLKQFSNVALYPLATKIVKKQNLNAIYYIYGDYKFNLLNSEKTIFYDINSKFLHIIFPFFFTGRTSGKRLFVLVIAIEDNEELLCSYNKDKKDLLFTKEFIKDFDENSLIFDIYDWFSHLREILKLSKKKYIDIYGDWPKIDLHKIRMT